MTDSGRSTSTNGRTMSFDDPDWPLKLVLLFLMAMVFVATSWLMWAVANTQPPDNRQIVSAQATPAASAPSSASPSGVGPTTEPTPAPATNPSAPGMLS